MFRNREKGKKEVKEPKKQKEKVRFKWHAPHDDNIIEKKTGLNLQKSTWEYGFSCFMTLVRIEVIPK